MLLSENKNWNCHLCHHFVSNCLLNYNYFTSRRQILHRYYSIIVELLRESSGRNGKNHKNNKVSCISIYASKIISFPFRKYKLTSYWLLLALLKKNVVGIFKGFFLMFLLNRPHCYIRLQNWLRTEDMPILRKYNLIGRKDLQHPLWYFYTKR